MQKSYLWIASLVSFMLGVSTVIPVITKQFEIAEASDILDETKLEPFIYTNFVKPKNSFGLESAVFKDINITFYRDWLNQTIQWSLQKSLDNSHWTECTELLIIDKIWNPVNLSEKHTLSWVSDEDAYYQLLLKTDDVETFQDKQIDNNILLNYSITSTEDYNIYYDWSDYSKSNEAAKTSMVKSFDNAGNKQSFNWKVYTNQKLAKDEKFSIDPTFGYSSTANYETLENTQRGSKSSPASDGYVDCITIGLYGAAYLGDVTCGIYAYTSDSDAGNLIAQTEVRELSLPVGWQNQFATFDLATPLQVYAGTNYFLATIAEEGGTLNIYYISTGSPIGLTESKTYGAVMESPWSGESARNYGYYIYATYNLSASITNPNPAADSYNQSVGGVLCNVTVTESTGLECIVDFYTSTDNSSWTWQQSNASVLNESVSFIYTVSDYDDTYYWKVTANNTFFNKSFYANFETTPYGDTWFNDTFNSENWVQSDNNMTFLSGSETAGYIPLNSRFGKEDTGTTASSLGSYPYGGSFTANYTGPIESFTMDLDPDSSDTDIKIGLYLYSDKTLLGSGIKTDNLGSDARGWYTIPLSSAVSVTNGTRYILAAMASAACSFYRDTETAVGFNNGYADTGLTYANFPETPWTPDYSYTDRNYSIYANFVDGYTSNITSDPIIKSSGNWDKFYAEVSLTANSTFSLLDSESSYVILSGLSGSGNDISSVTNSTVRIRGDFNNSVTLSSWNITWTAGAEAREWQTAENINGTLYNTSRINTITNINGSLYNISHIAAITNSNGTFYNATKFTQTTNWNGTLYNLTLGSYTNKDTVNGSLYNITYFAARESWNGTLYNYSGDDQVKNLNTGVYYTTIQEAINAASSGNQIYCNASTYYENIRINKTVSLLGAGVGNTSINGSQVESTVNISVSGVNLSNFTITEGNPCGICIGASDNTLIENCTVFNNSLYGIGTIYANWSTHFHNGVILNCNVSDNGNYQGEGYNVYIYYATNLLMNNVTTSMPRTLDNSASSKHGYGIFLYTCNYFNITNCQGHINYTDPTDTRPNETLNYAFDSDYGHINNCNYSGGWQYGFIFQYGGSKGIQVENCTFEHDEHGLFLDANINARIINNTFINCTGSDVSFPGAIWVQDGGGHQIYYNKFINCSVNTSTTVNIWYNPVTRMGNWHSEYDNSSEGAWDNNSDGRADERLGITDEDGIISEYDKYPLMEPYDGTILGAFFEEHDSWNGTLYNASAYIWYTMESWNGTLYNTTDIYTYVEDFDDDYLGNINGNNPDEQWYDAVVTGTRGNITEQVYTSGTHSMKLNTSTGEPTQIVFNLTNQTEISNLSYDLYLYNSPFTTSSDLSITLTDSQGYEYCVIRYFYNDAAKKTFLSYYKKGVETVLSADWGIRNHWYIGELLEFNYTDDLFRFVSNGTDYGWLETNTSADPSTVSIRFGDTGNQAHEVFLDNITIYCYSDLTPGWYLKENNNGTLYNVSHWVNIENKNGSLYNITGLQTITNVNGTLYNITVVSQMENWNGTLYNRSINTSVDQITPWKITNTTWTINATDYETNSSNVTLWYRYSADNTTFENASSVYGYTVMGYKGTYIQNEMVGNSISPSENGLIYNITVYLNNTWNAGEKVKCLIYKWNNGIADTFIGETEEKSYGHLSGGWVTFNFSSPIGISGNTNYTITAWSDSAVTMAYQVVAGEIMRDTWYVYGIAPDPLPHWDYNYSNNIASIYCGFEKNSTIWQPWQNSSNPDFTSSPWQWEFDFPNGTGYYQFYSIGTASFENETAPSINDTYCYYELFLQEWNNVTNINGTLYNTSAFTQTESINGTLYNVSHNTIIINWNGSLYNISGITLIENLNGTLYNSTTFKIIENINGTLYNSSVYWSTFDSMNGTLYNSTSFTVIASVNGTLFNLSLWFVSDSSNGTLYNTSNWLVFDSINGTLYNISSFDVIDTVNGTLYNATCYTILDSQNGTLYNISHWTNIENLNGSLYNITSFTLLDNWNGTLFNLTTQAEFVCSINGVVINCSYAGTGTPSEYRWESYRDANYDGDTGWCSGCKEMSWTYEEGGLVEIKLSINDSGDINSSSNVFIITSEGNYSDLEDFTQYTNPTDCIAAGFYWWNNSCHNCTQPYWWDEPEETPEAGNKTIFTELSKPLISSAVIFALILVFYFYFRYKSKNKPERKEKKAEKPRIHELDNAIVKIFDRRKK